MQPHCHAEEEGGRRHPIPQTAWRRKIKVRRASPPALPGERGFGCSTSGDAELHGRGETHSVLRNDPDTLQLWQAEGSGAPKGTWRSLWCARRSSVGESVLNHCLEPLAAFRPSKRGVPFVLVPPPVSCAELTSDSSFRKRN